eukprot:7167634-Pyramimonas_sp.AAC.1
MSQNSAVRAFYYFIRHPAAAAGHMVGKKCSGMLADRATLLWWGREDLVINSSAAIIATSSGPPSAWRSREATISRQRRRNSAALGLS